MAWYRIGENYNYNTDYLKLGQEEIQLEGPWEIWQ